MNIPMVDLKGQYESLRPEIDRAILQALAETRYILGPNVQAFDQEAAQYLGVNHAISCASGTDALVLGLKALGLQPGQGVLTSPFTFFASAGAVAWSGAKPQLCDVEPDTGLLDLEKAREAIDDTTKFLLPVHLYGQLVDVKGFRKLADERDLVLFEDAAQAHGAERDGVRAGEIGNAAAFSFYPTKNLGAAGEGGAVLCNDECVLGALHRLRDHGSTAKYVHDEIGTNSRLQAMQAAVLNVKLPHLDEWNARRRKTAAAYDAAFAASDAIQPLAVRPNSIHAYHQYAVRIQGDVPRDRVLEGLLARKIFAALHYPSPVHFQRAAADWGYREGDFPGAEGLAREVLCLPVHPFLSAADVERVSASVLELAEA